MTAEQIAQAKILVAKMRERGLIGLRQEPEPQPIKKGEPCPKCGRYQIGDLQQCLYCGV